MTSLKYEPQTATRVKKLMASAIILSMLLPDIHSAYANQEEIEQSPIRVYPKSYDLNKEGVRNLISPQQLKVECLEIDPSQKRITVFQTGQEPQEIQKIFQPSHFPWQLSSEKMENFLNSQSLQLKVLDDGSYKLDSYTIGKGGAHFIVGGIILGITAISGGCKFRGEGEFSFDSDDEQKKIKNPPVKKPTPKKAEPMKRSLPRKKR